MESLCENYNREGKDHGFLPCRARRLCYYCAFILRLKLMILCFPPFTGGHLGRDKTIEKIESRFYWRNMNGDIRDFVQRCDKCQRANPTFTKSNAKLHPIAVQSQVWHKVTLLSPIACVYMKITCICSTRLAWTSSAPFPLQLGETSMW